MKKLFLLDAFALIYRAHFAFIRNPLINSKGMNVSAITGFTNTLYDILRKEKPTHIAVVFDLPGPTFRHEMFEPYKAQREEQPEDITWSIPYIKDIIKGFNIPVASCAGYEADDVIGTLAKQAEKEGFTVYMMTPDKDYAQLVSENIFMYKPASFGNGIQILGVQEVLEKWQIARIDQVIDILGLQGDAVDNIPGIRGVGAKTAVNFIREYGSVEGLLENVDQLKGKMKEKVEAGKADALLSKQLATIAIDCPIQFDAEAYKVEPINKEALRPIFNELEFRRLAQRILGSEPAVQTDLFGNPIKTDQGATVKTAPIDNSNALAPNNIQNTQHQYHLVDDAEKRQALIKMLSQQKIFCFDTETTGLSTSEAELVGISFSIVPHEAWYVPLPVSKSETNAILSAFQEIFENEKIEKIGQNIKYDVLMLKWYGIEVKGRFWDTMIMHYLLEPESRHNMNYLSETLLKYSPVSIESLIGKNGKNQLSMRDVPLDKIKEYAGEDADITLQLKLELEKHLKDELLKLYLDIEEPLIHVLVEVEYNGVAIDVPFLMDYSLVLEKEIKHVKAKIYEQAGLKDFNLDSPKQVGQVFFEVMGIPYKWKKTKTGQYSTNEEKLKELSKEHQIVDDLLTYRSLAKLKSTYVDALPKLVSKRTKRIHSSFNQALTATGRLSSQNPNLQNIPIRSERGKEVRKAFVTGQKDHVLLAADYSQIELRLVAEISGDENMIAAFKNGDDIHKATAAKIYKVSLDEVTKAQRYNAKTVNFSIIYGAGATNLSKSLDIKRTEAKELIEQYFNEFSGLKSYMETVVNKAREKGYVSTLKGRRRHLRDINSRNGMIRSAAERNAINSPIQGSAADMIKIAMIKIHAALKENGLRTMMTSQVHDELIFEVPIGELDMVKAIVQENMATAIEDLQVPILVGMDTGDNWLDAH